MTFLIPRSRAGRRIALSVLLLAAGCAAPPPDHRAEMSGAQAAGLTEPISFRVEGGPLDESDSGGELSAADAVRRTVTTDPALQAALARVRVALADARQARLWPNPILNLVVRFESSAGGTPQVEASLAQDIVRIIQTPRRASAADNRLREAAADAVTAVLDAVLDVQERYSAAQSLDRLIPVLDEQMVLIDKVREVAVARLEAGEGVRSEVTTLGSQRVELEVELADARLRQRESRLRLARVIGEPSGAATWTLDAWQPPGEDHSTESQWIEAALANRPEVQSVAWRLAALGDDAALVALLPFEGAAAGVDAQRDGKWSVGPSVTTPVPVFDMGQAKRARVSAEQVEARHNLTLAKRRVVEEVRVAYQSLAASRENLRRIREDLLPLQRQRREQAEDSYRAGLSDVTLLFLAEQDLRAAEAKAVEVEHQASITLARLHRAVGGPGIAATLAISPNAQPAPESN